MIHYKNPKVVIDRVPHEIVWITEFADHIAKNHYDQHDTARHLNFEQIQDVILNADRLFDENPPYVEFYKKLPDKKEYLVIALVQGKRVVPKSGRINNLGFKRQELKR